MLVTYRRCAQLAVALAVVALSALAVAGAAAADTPVDVDDQCRFQYAADGVFGDGAAYVAAPGDAYSWRCQRVRLGGGGVLSGLGVDVGAFCGRAGLGVAVVINRSDAYSWRCR